MAILSKEMNQVEICIRRYPEKTYFDEYVKVGDREKKNATSCERYIIPEPGKIYEIKVTLRKGYQFGNCNSVMILLLLPGFEEPVSIRSIHRPRECEQGEVLKEDKTVHLSYTHKLPVNGILLTGSRLCFQGLTLGTYILLLAYSALANIYAHRRGSRR
jgi:hypothetical protein